MCDTTLCNQTQPPIAERGGLFNRMVSTFFKGMDDADDDKKKRTSSPCSADDPVLARHTTVTVADKPAQSAGFSYSAHLLANIVMKMPMSERLLELLPLAFQERADILMMAITMFHQVMRLLNGEGVEKWDNENVNSRVALALSASLACKFVMDATPLGPMFALSCTLRAGELYSMEEQLMEFVLDYESRMINALPIYRCYFNHFSWACAFVEEHACSADVETLQHVCLFTAYNITEFVTQYCLLGQCLVGPAIGVLSIECIMQSGAGRCEHSIHDHAPKTLELAMQMATDAADQNLERMQRCFGPPFSNALSIEHKSTTVVGFRKARLALSHAHRKLVSASADR